MAKKNYEKRLDVTKFKMEGDGVVRTDNATMTQKFTLPVLRNMYARVKHTVSFIETVRDEFFPGASLE